ncbi:hypothetical protein VC83_01673 [Pseudogymnoascus destructans]|uniref:Alternative oxidase n=1 Tax=Pseudogymnoascus destructans TaxID=655981 RepID=A0A177AKS4_9PEZI|nr:uncharacterized protein VC83_01673 [Pseudogymnoascus destructans]OAF62102.1 hypothetical protein VC83_01673 [Pseudogymnoascus destructans]
MLPFKPPLRALMLFVAVSTAFLYFTLYRHDLHHLTTNILPLGKTDKLPKGTNLDDKASFIQAFLEHEIDGRFDPAPIQKVCASKTWNDNLTIVCGAPQGGIGNIRNVFLTCLRYAIEAGGAFVVPEIVKRDADDLSKLTTNNTVPFDYFFDLEHFKASLALACPQMALYTTAPGDLVLNPPIDLSPQHLLSETFAATVILRPEKWRPAFDGWLSEHPPIAPGRSTISLATPLLNFPIYSDPTAFMTSFGRLLRIREPSRRLAAAAVHALRTKHNIPITPIGITPSAFFGAHLRVAADATKAGWTGYEQQAAFLLHFADEVKLKTLYVTSESAPAETFRTDAAKRGAMALAKEDLLDEAEMEALRAMTWDQQALVDYEVLLRASAFGGIELSSFAWNVALRRHVVSRTKRKAWEGVKEGGGMNFKDEYSRLRGEKGAHSLFVEAMWP